MSAIKKVVRFFSILVVESYTTIRYVFPAAVSWMWKKYVCYEIKTIEIQLNDTQKIAFLNIHGKLSATEGRRSVLLSHGDYAHPYTMLHLAKIAQKRGVAVFSIYIPKLSEEQAFKNYSELLKKAIDIIENLTQEENERFPGILGVGHSKGAILLAQRLFVNLDPRIKSVCAIAGRLNVSKNKKGSRFFTKILKKIYRGITKNFKKPLVQIVPQDDWKVSYESMAVRPKDHCHSVPGMHLSGLYEEATRRHFDRFLRKFSYAFKQR